MYIHIRQDLCHLILFYTFTVDKRHSIDSLWSHQETWNGWTFKRDRAVKNWCNLKDINWHEIPQNGVIRCLKNRDGWAAKWHAAMNKPIAKKPKILIKIDEDSDELLTYQELGLKNDDHLVKLTAITQRYISTTQTISGESSLLSEEEKKDLLNMANITFSNELEEELDKIDNEEKELAEKITNVKKKLTESKDS